MQTAVELSTKMALIVNIFEAGRLKYISLFIFIEFKKNAEFVWSVCWHTAENTAYVLRIKADIGAI